MTLSTPWSRSMGLTVPIVNAPMGGAAGARLAAAVASAGGLGMVGMGSAGSAEALRAELAGLPHGAAPIGIGLVGWVAERDPVLLDVAVAAAPALLSVSFGDEWSWVAKAHEAGLMVATQVADVGAARRAVEAGVDVLVARGAEGGGHGAPSIGTLPLLAEVLDSVDVPVLAAGGIASPRALAAVLAAGAAGAWVGTALATCTEALTPPAARDQLLAAESNQTATTRKFDIAAQYPWPATLPERVLLDAVGEPTPVNAGQGVGAVRTQRAAGDLISEWCSQAADLLGRWA
ncbi:nitronate monooxygenase [Mycolicibacterium confluentis]|nr:nitronate monooxygenase [Mycolicibacterium confluentis]MCV7319957.1 nitronate monooxygenase [Mycolicibacterium confluentis]ORV34515.1 2-nitropropane dioxygenase [Mycolicibacterium confluentis]